jgi:HK97 family phage major capsid protein
MWKIKLAALLALAKQEYGYTGSETDPEAIRKHLIDQKAVLKDSKGNALDVSKADIDCSRKAVTVEVEAEPKVETKAVTVETNTEDQDAKVKSLVETALKAAGVDIATTKRPGNPTAEVSKVKGPDQREWEAAAQQNGSAFKSWERAALFRDYLLSQVIGSSKAVMAAPDWRAGVESAEKRLRSDTYQKAYGTTPNAAGGALTSTEFYPEFISNLLQYGVARKLAKVVSMSQERMEIPVETGIPDVYFPAENAANTASTGVSYSNVQLNAKTAVTTAQISKQLLQDANLSVMDNFVKQAARGMAYKEDTCFFTANGEATNGGMVGVNTALTVVGAAADAASNVSGATAPTTHTMAMFTNMIARCPQYARANARWTATPGLIAQNMLRLGLAQGGVTYAETQDNGIVMKFLGFPVVENNLMNVNTDASGQRDFWFGDFSRAVVFGDRMSFEFAVDESIFFTSYAVAVRGVERFFINVVDVGTTTVAGPIVALVQT